ncbi:hypothetical protein BCR44DRAFT_1440636 [Catenaria anguillulae PL171]|uniref:Uncharacterized protein n=1 Tax=Catenaria anguillulae PL171 TaxID=765915 RepID=A0A1Y2HCP0_9FUNG|nr:hypothetical protein BCR44DRAFT_1440636 [Catenaria anguillulae PL171]
MPGLASILDFLPTGLTILHCLAQPYLPIVAAQASVAVSGIWHFFVLCQTFGRGCSARTRPRPGPSDGSMDSLVASIEKHPAPWSQIAPFSITFYCRGLIRHGWFRYLSDSLSSLPKSGPNSSLLGPHAHVLEPAAPCIVVFQHFGPLRDLASE